jgi:hypothetical protein
LPREVRYEIDISKESSRKPIHDFYTRDLENNLVSSQQEVSASFTIWGDCKGSEMHAAWNLKPLNVRIL